MTNNTSPYDLPEQPGLIDPFIRCDGTRLESPGDWLKHRVDLMAMPCHYLYVDLPKRPVKIGVRLEADSEVFDGKASATSDDSVCGAEWILLGLESGEDRSGCVAPAKSAI